MGIQRIYCPRHLLTPTSSSAAADSVASPADSYYVIGWANERREQMCIATWLTQTDIELHNLQSLLQSLKLQPDLQALWTLTHGPPELIGVVNSQTNNSSLLQFQYDPLTSQLPQLRGNHGSDLDTCQFILFDAPSSPYSYAIHHPFAYPHTTTIDSQDPDRDVRLETCDEIRSSSSSIATVLDQINACRTVESMMHQLVASSVSSSEDLVFQERAPSTSLLSPLWNGCSFGLHYLLQPIFFICELLLQLLNHRTISFTRLISSFFLLTSEPSTASESAYQLQPFWMNGHGLTVLKTKLEFMLDMDKLSRLTTFNKFDYLNVESIARIRLREEYWSLLLNQCLDTLLGIVCGSILLIYFGLIDSTLFPFSTTFITDFTFSPYFHDFSTSISSAFEWLLSSDAPAGLKLNPRLHGTFGRILRQIIIEQEWMKRSLIQMVLERPVILVLLRSLSRGFLFSVMILGMRFFLGVLLDLCWLISTPFQLLSSILSRLYSFTLRIFSSLFLLFRGKKRNILRKNRVDSFTGGSFEHLLLGTLCLVIITFLFPTVSVWYGIGLVVKVGVFDAPTCLLWIASSLIQLFPIAPLAMWLCDQINFSRSSDGGKRIPGGVWLEVLAAGPRTLDSTAGDSFTSHDVVPTTYFRLHSASPPLTSLFFRLRHFLHTALKNHPPQAILARLVNGAGAGRR